MKALILTRYGSVDNLVIAELPKPSDGQIFQLGKVVIKVET